MSRQLRVASLVALPIIVEALVVWRVLGPLEHTLFPDDAFYYLCVGRNLADGFGPTFDGVHATTGFQPLWQAIVALVALGPFDPAALTWAVGAVNLACVAIAVGIVAVAFSGRGLLPGIWTLVVLVAFANPYLLKTSFNGMESGLVWVCWSLALVVLTRGLEGRTGTLDAAVAGAVAGAAVLTRIDGLGLVAGLAWVTAAASGGQRVRRLAAFAAAAAIVTGPYVAWMWIRFGHWLPVSVLVKSDQAATNVPALAIVGALFAAGVGLVTHGARRSTRELAGIQPAPAGAAALAVLAGLLPLTAYATADRGRLTHLWYYPGLLIGILLLAALVASGLWTRRRRGLVVAGAIAGLAVAAGVWTLRLAAHRGDHYRVADAMGRRLQTLPADVRVGGWNVGLIAYRRSCRVTNLDGLINSYAYLDAMREKRVAAWLDAEGITGLVDYFEVDPLVALARRDPVLPGRVVERIRMDYRGPFARSASPDRQAFIYFDYRPVPRR